MQAVIIAAGESKRFWPLNNGIHKSQFKLLGKPLVYWALKGLAENDIRDVAIVVGKNSSMRGMLAKENVRQLADGMKINYLVQEEPLGTGNALWQAKDFIKERFVLLWGNKAGSKELVKQIIEKQKKDNADAVLVGTAAGNPSEYGVFRFDGEKVAEIVENPDQGKEPSNIAFAGARLLAPDFFEYYEKLSKHHEADLVDATNIYLKDKKVSLLMSEGKGLTLKYPWDLFSIMDVLFELQKPAISPSAKIGKNVVIDGPVYIGENCVIGHHNVLRGPVNLEANCKTGVFMEIKHSIVQEGTTFHSGYLGDSIIGKNCRFGAGFITGNLRFDKKPIYGLPKLGVIVGDNSAFGIHSGIMPGVLIGANCVVGPGTHVFKDLPDHTAYYAKPENVIK
ncbi:MAG: hypothetical protein A2940_02590 [Candidatus Wildermuthbacteria bacterium RIFCSPLOWO2_01_FULL_48_29]|uniref:Nucleotidyl transferase domain-containing protein n=2 Tax=Candidatus Wildermuthiibacteriota TaxID=1817923 RepID=A0A1G2RL48_9BACT|nr:MAG: hypothetical protein A2843_01435 [Candidatus Wildermuthbacteria bacterium RIFCSPHIGHO2_01_FULL_48_27b]OHA73570.1 MAG: hypothetical protein A2940_02590 [Candidatus Wildermuthbacteria bacterium RIFCSPLOWO2_01_FULL_48_29]